MALRATDHMDGEWLGQLERIQGHCARVERTILSPLIGEIELLRAARVIRRIHGDLRRALTVHVRKAGWSRQAMTIQSTLESIESDLRHVLLGYPQVRDRELRTYIARACESAQVAIDLLIAGSPEAEIAAAG